MLQWSYYLWHSSALALKVQTISGRHLACVWSTEMCTGTEVTDSIAPVANPSQNPSSDYSPFLILTIRVEERWCTRHVHPGLLLPNFHKPRAQELSKLPTAPRPRYVLTTNQTSPPRNIQFLSTNPFLLFLTKTLCDIKYFVMLFCKSDCPSLYIGHPQLPC